MTYADRLVDVADPRQADAPALPAEQPRAGLMFLCKCCGDGLVGRGVYDSGYCRTCRADVVEGARS